jgi:hypothetical protein
MKRQSLVLSAILLLLGVSAYNWSKPGCMDNSWHLKKKFDDKTYHYVQCNCPCDTYRAQGFYAPMKHKCLECGHKHEAHTTLIVPKIPADSPHNPFPTIKGALLDLIARWKKSQN